MPSERRNNHNESSSHHRSKSKKHSKDREEDPSDNKPKKSSSRRHEDEGDEERKHRSSKHKDEDDSERKHRSSRHQNDEDEERKHRSSKHKDEDDSERKHRSSRHQNDEGEERKHRSSKHKDEDDGERKHRSSRKHDDEPRHKSKSHHRDTEDVKEEYVEVARAKTGRHRRPDNAGEDREDRMNKYGRSKEDKVEKERSPHRYESARLRPNRIEDEKNQEEEDEPDYDEDFDDDFEDESEDEVPTMVRKQSRQSSDSDQIRRSNNSSRSRYDNDDYDEYMRGRVMKANAHVQVPTEIIEVYSSHIAFNHDSRDRQERRAADLLKTIELDVKSFNLLDINPEDMRTVYSSHLRHEKSQTNDDTVEIEAQTDEIEHSTRWTQCPPEDLRGYGAENTTVGYEEDLFGKFRLEVNFIELQGFLDRASRVVEALLKENNLDAGGIQADHTTDLNFSKGFAKLSMPKWLTKKIKHAVLSEVNFCQDDSGYLVCTYDLETGPDRFTSSFLVVWNVNEPEKPYKVLVCESKSNCVVYTSFMVFSGNVDGSVTVWDLREPFNLHLANQTKKTFSTVDSVTRSPTYSTAGVLLNDNHFSEVKSIIALQNKSIDNEKGVFLQLATLELESRLIIWTVVELSHIDLAGFETDLGLLPGGRLKLVKSSQIDLTHLLSPFGKDSYLGMGLVCPVRQANNFYVGTNMGRIVHVLRESDRSSITTLKSSCDDGSLQVTALQCHHEIQELMLAGYGNGELRLYHTKFDLPIKTWHFSCQGNKITAINWIPSKRSAFVILDNKDNLYLWNLLEDDTGPIFTQVPNGCGKFAMSWAHQANIDDGYETVPFVMFDPESRDLEMHLFSSEWTKRNEKENKKFAKFIRNILLTF